LKPAIPATPSVAIQPIQLAQPAGVTAQPTETVQFTKTGGIEVQGLDLRNPQRPKLRVVCTRAYRQLQVHVDGRRLAFNAPRPGELRSLPLPSEWSEAGTQLTLYGIESSTSEQLVWKVPEAESASESVEWTSNAETPAADLTGGEVSAVTDPGAEGDQQLPALNELLPSPEPYREE